MEATWQGPLALMPQPSPPRLLHSLTEADVPWIVIQSAIPVISGEEAYMEDDRITSNSSDYPLTDKNFPIRSYPYYFYGCASSWGRVEHCGQLWARLCLGHICSICVHTYNFGKVQVDSFQQNNWFLGLIRANLTFSRVVGETETIAASGDLFQPVKAIDHNVESFVDQVIEWCDAACLQNLLSYPGKQSPLYVSMIKDL